MPTKTRQQLYNDISDAVEELRRQDEVNRESDKTYITNLEDLKKHVRAKYGAGVIGNPDNHLMYGAFQLANGKMIVYNVQNI